MWLWILSGLFLTLLWGMWFLLRPAEPGPAAELLPTWIPIVATVVIVLLLVGLIVYRRIRAARAARALEKAIAQQAQEQALNAKPERVAEIEELHRQVQAGINALKASKLGGGRSGSDALYSLPWYAMVGPPGAGKTTALRHSGLVFPFLDSTGGGVRGVGGTRNCDWWFTNEAILLDTAGRYTTEADDHDEWMAFLEMLLKFRSHKPLNGVIVAVSITELLDGTEEQIQQVGRKVRARVDEMQATLHMVLPVYVLFTKCDLIAGFSEYFGDFKKSERSQAWGATLRLDADKAEPGKLFDAEFDTMVERIHDRSLKRMATERSRETKEKVYQFPLEFAAIKRNLSDFVASFLAPSAGEKVAGSGQPGGGYPIFRGFYFTSGTQEGKPLDRVVGAMGRAFGLKAGPSEDLEPKALESKSYFLRDVFMNVIFPDQDIAARTEVEIRRQRLQRYGAALVALAIALLFFIPACISYNNNKGLVAKTGQVSKAAAEVQWGEPTDALPKIDKLDELRAQAEQLQDFEESTPVTYGWFMYQGDKLVGPTIDQYVFSLRQGFVDRVKARLEDELKNANNKPYRESYENLKTYLLLNDKYKPHLLPDEADRQKNRLTQLWADLLRPHTDMSETDLKLKLAPHVAYYVKLLQSPLMKGEANDEGLVESTRDILRKVGSAQRYYDLFVTTLVDQKYDPNGPSDDPENLQYPPVSLKDMFRDRPEVLTKVRSGQKERTGKWFAVQGPYTSKGHTQVLASLQEGNKLLEREKWVVPTTSEEKDYAAEVQKSLDRVRMDYNAEYITQWVNFFRDIQVEEPPNNKEAVAEFRILATPDAPYLRLLRALDDATQFAGKEEAEQNALQADGGVVDQLRNKVKQRIEAKTGTKVDSFLGGGKAGEPRDPIPDKFKSMVGFGVSPPVKEGASPPPPPGLDKYVGLLDGLAGEVGVIEDGPPSSDTTKVRGQFEDAVRTTESLLLGMDETGQELMKPLLMNPLKLGFKAVVRSAGGAASGLWEVSVWPTYRDKIKDRYPFNLASSRDASYEDAVAFFKPKDGILWSFYDAYLKPFHSQIGHDFVPISHLAGSRSAKPYTPFNPNLYNCLQRADEITDALFGSGGDSPKVAFQLNLKTVSPIVSDVIFEVDGQTRHYRNEKPFWHEFSWPGEKPTGARIQVRGAGGLDEELVREGRWGLFRLFEAATTTAKKDSDDVFTVTWQMTAPPVTVVMEIRPTRGNHPFPSSFFRATNCPNSIGDKFGKGS